MLSINEIDKMQRVRHAASSLQAGRGAQNLCNTNYQFRFSLTLSIFGHVLYSVFTFTPSFVFHVLRCIVLNGRHADHFTCEKSAKYVANKEMCVFICLLRLQFYDANNAHGYRSAGYRCELVHCYAVLCHILYSVFTPLATTEKLEFIR